MQLKCMIHADEYLLWMMECLPGNIIHFTHMKREAKQICDRLPVSWTGLSLLSGNSVKLPFLFRKDL